MSMSRASVSSLLEDSATDLGDRAGAQGRRACSSLRLDPVVSSGNRWVVQRRRAPLTTNTPTGEAVESGSQNPKFRLKNRECSCA